MNARGSGLMAEKITVAPPFSVLNSQQFFPAQKYDSTAASIVANRAAPDSNVIIIAIVLRVDVLIILPLHYI